MPTLPLDHNSTLRASFNFNYVFKVPYCHLEPNLSYWCMGVYNSVHNVKILNMAPLHTRRTFLGSWFDLFSCILYLNLKFKVLEGWPPDFCVYQNCALGWLTLSLAEPVPGVSAPLDSSGWDCVWEASRWWWHCCLENHISGEPLE